MKLFGLKIGGKSEASDSSSQMMFDDTFDEYEVATAEVFNRDKNGVLSIGGKDYAVGMFWNSASDATSAVAEAKATAKSPGLNADFYTVRGEGVPQYGLGYKGSGHKAGMPSLASYLNHAIEGNWIGVFEYGENNFYLVAVRDDAILADCDKVYTSEDDVREEFSDLYYSSTWENAFAPESWDIEGTQEKFIDDFTLGSPIEKLKDVNSTKTIIKFGGAAAVVGAIFLGANTFLTEPTSQFIPPEYEEEFDDMSQDTSSMILEDNEVEVLADPWFGKARGLNMMAACVENITSLPISISGWNVKGTMCLQDTTSMLLENAGGTINWVSYDLNKTHDPSAFDIEIMSEGDVEVVFYNEVLPQYPENVDNLRLDELEYYLRSHFDEKFVDIELERSTKEGGKDVSVDGDTQIIETTNYDVLSFTYQAPYSPLEFAEIFSRIPTFVIDKIEYSITSGTWIVAGKAFNKNITTEEIIENY